METTIFEFANGLEQIAVLANCITKSVGQVQLDLGTGSLSAGPASDILYLLEHDLELLTEQMDDLYKEMIAYTHETRNAA